MTWWDTGPASSGSAGATHQTRAAFSGQFALRVLCAGLTCDGLGPLAGPPHPHDTAKGNSLPGDNFDGDKFGRGKFRQLQESKKDCYYLHHLHWLHFQTLRQHGISMHSSHTTTACCKQTHLCTFPPPGTPPGGGGGAPLHMSKFTVLTCS